MPVRKLDHYNIWTNCFDKTMHFYTDVLGLRDGPRPPVSLPGAWLYDDTDSPVVHIVDVPSSDAKELVAAGGRNADTLSDSGAVDHLAFDSVDFDDMCARLGAEGFPYREDGIPAANVRQIFVRDPNGIQLELNFRG